MPIFNIKLISHELWNVSILFIFNIILSLIILCYGSGVLENLLKKKVLLPQDFVYGTGLKEQNNMCLFPSKMWYFLKMQKLRKVKDQKSLLLQTIILKGCFKYYISPFCNVLLQLELCLWGKVFCRPVFT